MACKPQHSNQTIVEGIHSPVAFEYADATARTGASGFDADDLNKFARQTDDDTIWMLTATTPTWVQVGGAPAATATAQLLWGNDNIATSTTPRFLEPGYSDNGAETAPTEMRLVRAGTLQTMRIRHTTAGVGTANLTYTLLINGTPTALTVTMSNTVQDGSDLVNSVVVAAGDIATLRVTKSTGLTTSPDNLTCTVEYA